MRIRKKPWARPELDACPFHIKNPTEQKGKWHAQFENEQPLHIELGCGKGGFISKMASQHPEINFLAVDVINEMLALARRNVQKKYEILNRPVDNIRLILQNIEYIDTIFSAEDSADRIYINFCNPWPRKKHNKRRLTHPRQLEKYKIFLKPGGEIWFKTDDDGLFTESVPYFEENGFEVRYSTKDLHNSGFTESLATEHEKMFTEMGIPTKFLIAVKL